MADKFMKVVLYQRLQEISKQLPHMQTAEWKLENPESMLTAGKVLRSQTINLLRAFARRQVTDNQIRCVDTKLFKEHLNSQELLAESRWAWKYGHTTAFRLESMLELKDRDLQAGTLGSISC